MTVVSVSHVIFLDSNPAVFFWNRTDDKVQAEQINRLTALLFPSRPQIMSNAFHTRRQQRNKHLDLGSALCGLSPLASQILVVKCWIPFLDKSEKYSHKISTFEFLALCWGWKYSVNKIQSEDIQLWASVVTQNTQTQQKTI